MKQGKEIKALIKKVEALFEKEAFKKIIELLSETLLKKYNNSDLYAWLARANVNLNEPDLCIKFAQKAIAIDSNNPFAYLQLANAWASKMDNNKAIENYDKAIELKPTYALAFFNKGLACYKNGDNDKSIANYDKAINLKPDYAYAYNNRGVVLNELKKYDKAIEDYTKAIELKPDYVLAYNNRGFSWDAIGDNDKAYENFIKAIEINPNYYQSYRNRGGLKEKLNDFSGALKDYEIALKLNPNDNWSEYFRDQISAKMGIPIKMDDAKADATLYQIVNAVNELDKEMDKLDLIKYYKLEIEPIIKTIREFASKIESVFGDNKKGNLLAHYSNLKTADLLINNKNTHIRYSNAVFMNDPEEGKILIDYLDVLEGETEEIKKAFYNIQKEEKTNFYLGSFLPVKDNHEDELLMWRTYGKDENKNEAAGCCLLIDSSFFDEADGKHIAMASDKEIKQDEIAHPLYKVIYYNKRTKKIEGEENKKIVEEIEKLKLVLKALLKKKRNKSEKKNKAIDRILYHSLSELRYFFKSADYYFENELRVIQFATHKEVVKIDTESGSLPRRMYIESSKEIKPHIKKIILGPKVQYPERWIYLEELMKREGHNMDMSFSNCQYQ